MSDTLFYNKLKVYLDGTMIVFADENDELITSEPRGTITALPSRTADTQSGFVFVKQVTGTKIAAVTGYDDVLDETGTAYGANFADVLTALNAFLGFNAGGGGGGVTGAENGLNVVSNKVRLGGALIEDTDITEDGFDFTADREETVEINGYDYGPVTTYYKSYVGQPFPDQEPYDSLVRSFGEVDALGDCEIGVYGNAYYGPTVFYKASQQTGPTLKSELFFKGRGGDVQWEAGTRDTGTNTYTQDFYFRFSGTIFQMFVKGLTLDWSPSGYTLNNDTNQFNITGGVRVNTFKNTDPTKADVRVTEVPINEVLTGLTAQTVYQVPILNNQYARLEFEGVYYQVGVSGMGVVDKVVGGGGRNGAAALQAVTSTESVITVGAVTTSSFDVVASANNLNFRINPNSAGDTEISGILKVTIVTMS